MAWRIEVTNTAQKQLAKLDRQVQTEIVRYLRERIGTNDDPRRFGAPLRKELAGRWKYRVGGYRLICEIQDEKILVLVDGRPPKQSLRQKMIQPHLMPSQESKIEDG